MSCALAGALLAQLGQPGPRLVRDATALNRTLAEGDWDLLLIDRALPGLQADTQVDALAARLRDADHPELAAPVCVELRTSPGSAPAQLQKPLRREAVQTMLQRLDFDSGTWTELLGLFGAHGARQMLDALRRDLVLQRDTLAQGQADGETLGRIGHRLRGAALQFGARNLASHGARAERLAEDDLAQTVARLRRLLDRFETLVGYLERQLES